jgi:hypothetical protein
VKRNLSIEGRFIKEEEPITELEIETLDQQLGSKINQTNLFDKQKTSAHTQIKELLRDHHALKKFDKEMQRDFIRI